MTATARANPTSGVQPFGWSDAPESEQRITSAIGPSSANTFVVLAAFCEEKVIADVVSAVAERFPNVVVVDDCSPDETAEQAERAGATVLRHRLNRGQGAALQTGIEFALGQGAGIVVTFDSDGQHDPADIGRLVEPIVDGKADVVLGSRFLGSATEMPFGRRLVLRMAVLFTRATSGMRLTDTHNGLRALSRPVAGKIALHLDRMAHASEFLDQIARSGARVTEVPVHIRYTEYSRAKGQRTSGAVRIIWDYVMGRLTR